MEQIAMILNEKPYGYDDLVCVAERSWDNEN